MIPDGPKSANLPNPVRVLAAILHYHIKNKADIKISITQTVKLFGIQKKAFRQSLKGVCYESSSQKHRRLDAAHDKGEGSSSSETDNDDDDEEEGAFARIKPLQKCKHKK